VIENNYSIKLVNAKDLTEGDALLNNVRIGKKVIKKSVHGLSLEQIKMLRKSKKKVWIKEGLVFVPVILVSVIVSLFLGNLFFSIIYGILS
jgi:prepilin signal peptidase PulO-like enzyme (type II secretory pathway)